MRRFLLTLALCALLPVMAQAATDDAIPPVPVPPHWVLVIDVHHGIRLTWTGDLPVTLGVWW